MKISEHIINQEQREEYFKIFFEIPSNKDITYRQYQEIEDLIYKKILEFNEKL